VSTPTRAGEDRQIAGQLDLLVRAAEHLEQEINFLAAENSRMVAGVSAALHHPDAARAGTDMQLLAVLQAEDRVSQGLRQAARALRVLGQLVARLADGKNPPGAEEMAAALLDVHHLAETRAQLEQRLSGAAPTAPAPPPAAGVADLF